jgi:hypothetical protein
MWKLAWVMGVVLPGLLYAQLDKPGVEEVSAAAPERARERAWLANGHWDIIHFNWGLWDLS